MPLIRHSGAMKVPISNRLRQKVGGSDDYEQQSEAEKGIGAQAC
jgi:hypothetical protein